MDGQVLELACQKYYREGHKDGFEEGRELEKQRADAAEAKIKELETLLKKNNIPITI